MCSPSDGSAHRRRDHRRPVAPVLHVSTSGTDARLRRQADRRLSGRRAELAGRHDRIQRGGLSAARARRAVPRSLPPRSGEAAWRSCRTSPDSLRFAMPDINHTFKKGHRIMVQIQSSWFPLNDRNPQTFVDTSSRRSRRISSRDDAGVSHDRRAVTHRRARPGGHAGPTVRGAVASWRKTGNATNGRALQTCNCGPEGRAEARPYMLIVATSPMSRRPLFG